MPLSRDPSLDLAGVLRSFPPGPFRSEDNDSDNDSIQLLDEAPEHMRRRSNKDAPIPVESSDSDGDAEQSERGAGRKGKGKGKVRTRIDTDGRRASRSESGRRRENSKRKGKERARRDKDEDEDDELLPSDEDLHPPLTRGRRSPPKRRDVRFGTTPLPHGPQAHADRPQADLGRPQGQGSFAPVDPNGAEMVDMFGNGVRQWVGPFWNDYNGVEPAFWEDEELERQRILAGGLPRVHIPDEGEPWDHHDEAAYNDLIDEEWNYGLATSPLRDVVARRMATVNQNANGNHHPDPIADQPLLGHVSSSPLVLARQPSPTRAKQVKRGRDSFNRTQRASAYAGRRDSPYPGLGLSDDELEGSDKDEDDDLDPFQRHPEVDFEAQQPKKRRRVDFAVPNMLERQAAGAGPSRPVNSRLANNNHTATTEPGPSITAPDADTLLLEVVAILPDIDPTWALTNLACEIKKGLIRDIGNHIINLALEMEGGYPKAQAKTKGKEKEKDVEEGSDEKYKSMRYRKSQRVGREYLQLSLQTLESDFPRVPVPHVRGTFYSLAYLYAPAYFQLMEESKMDRKPYNELKRPRTGKIRVIQLDVDAGIVELEDGDQFPINDGGKREFYLEKAFVNNVEAVKKAKEEEELTRKNAREEALAAGLGVECGCCFGEEICADMIQCSEGHLFCRECATKHAETRLGDQQTSILCMEMSGCQSPFLISELSKILSDKSIELYHRLKQSREIEEANIQGLEMCPYCPFAAVIENPDEKLFRCQTSYCMKVTCRKCKYPDHIPKTCEEMAQDRKLDKRHAVEDAMSDALIRKCPKCAKPFIKESGCNKIHCQGCHTLSCYICRKAIPEGYAHFDQQPGTGNDNRITGKCPLWDQNEAQMDHDAILAARDAAQETARQMAVAQGVELAEGDLEVAMPDRPDELDLLLPRAGHLRIPVANPFHYGHGGMPPQIQLPVQAWHRDRYHGNPPVQPQPAAGPVPVPQGHGEARGEARRQRAQAQALARAQDRARRHQAQAEQARMARLVDAQRELQEFEQRERAQADARFMAGQDRLKQLRDQGHHLPALGVAAAAGAGAGVIDAWNRYNGRYEVEVREGLAGAGRAGRPRRH